MKIHVPPIKIQGIKTKLVEWIKPNVEIDENTRWVEPFMGSGVVGFNIFPKRALFCDLNPHLINFYNDIKRKKITSDNTRLFLQAEGAKLSKYGQKYFYEVRERFNNTHEPLDFLFLDRSCFNGMIRFNKKLKYNVPFGHKPQRFAKAYITKIVNQIKYIELALSVNQWEFRISDFKKTLDNIDSDDFVYCDPPYIDRHIDYYDSWNDEDEKELYNILNNSNAKFILSTWYGNKFRKNRFIDSLWSDFYIMKREHFYHIGAKEENRHPMIEALVMNFRPNNSYNKDIGKEKQNLLLYSQ